MNTKVETPDVEKLFCHLETGQLHCDSSIIERLYSFYPF